MASWIKVVSEASAGAIAQNTTGNAATATALETARAITLTGVVTGTDNFDGTAEASITTSLAAGVVGETNLDVAGLAGTVGQVLASDGAGGFAWAEPDSGGTVTEISAGDGLDFTSITISGAVTLGTPGTLSAASTNAVTATSHTHAITASSNPGAAAALLATDGAGALTLASLSITADLDVAGTLTTINTENLRVSDTVIQLNTVIAGDDYSDSNAAIMLGNAVQADGGKIINADGYFAFTSLHTSDMPDGGVLPAGSVSLGAYKQVRMLDIVLGEQATLPAVGMVHGQVAFDGADLFVYVV